MKDKTKVIAIDGAAATGKSTLAKILATDLGYVYMDTGLMFRALTYEALQRNIIHEGGMDHEALFHFLSDSRFDWKNDQLVLNEQLYGDEIRTLKVSEEVSNVAAQEVIRKFTLENQRRLAADKNIVMDGRDIGSVVFPDANHKFFLQATPEVRAERRWQELQQKGEQVTLNSVLENVRLRDKKDSERKHAPLKQAADAILIDTTQKSITDVLDLMKSYID